MVQAVRDAMTATAQSSAVSRATFYRLVESIEASSRKDNRPAPWLQDKHNPITSTVVTAPVNSPRHLSVRPAAPSVSRTLAGVATIINGFHPATTAWSAPGPANIASHNNGGGHDDTDSGMADSLTEAPGYDVCLNNPRPTRSFATSRAARHPPRRSPDRHDRRRPTRRKSQTDRYQAVTIPTHMHSYRVESTSLQDSGQDVLRKGVIIGNSG